MSSEGFKLFLKHSGKITRLLLRLNIDKTGSIRILDRYRTPVVLLALSDLWSVSA